MAHIALYGGAFDPPHAAHAFAVTWLLGQVDAVWLVPAFDHAFGKRMSPFADRLDMLRLALRAFDPQRVAICTVEAERAGPSLTFDTLTALGERHPEHTFSWVIGADNLTEAPRWYRFEELVSRWRMFVLGRPGHEAALLRAEDAPWCVPGPMLPDVSSSAIRAALAGQGDAAILRWVEPAVAERGRGLYTRERVDLPPVHLIGGGNVASALRAALAAARVPSVGQWQRADGPLPRHLFDADAPPGVVVLAVPDPAIAEVAARLAAECALTPGTTVLHCAARFGAEVLAPLAGKGLHLGSMHPLQSLRDSARAVDLLRGAYFGLEGDPLAVSAAEALVRAVGGRPVRVPTGGKPTYHAAAVFSGNFTATLMGGGTALLCALGFPEAEARALLLPLLRGTLSNLEVRPAALALTGPFARGDVDAVAAHVQAMAANAPGFLPAYVALASATAEWLDWPADQRSALDAALRPRGEEMTPA